VTFVEGLQVSPIRGSINQQGVTYGTGATFPAVGVKLDTTTGAPNTGCSVYNPLTTLNLETVDCDFYPVLGLHFLQAVSHASVNDSTFTYPLKISAEANF
jgi:hypothetical protein